MPRIVISNSTCLIALERISKLHLLRELYGEVIVPVAVQAEIKIAKSD